MDFNAFLNSVPDQPATDDPLLRSKKQKGSEKAPAVNIPGQPAKPTFVNRRQKRTREDVSVVEEPDTTPERDTEPAVNPAPSLNETRALQGVAHESLARLVFLTHVARHFTEPAPLDAAVAAVKQEGLLNTSRLDAASERYAALFRYEPSRPPTNVATCDTITLASDGTARIERSARTEHWVRQYTNTYGGISHRDVTATAHWPWLATDTAPVVVEAAPVVEAAADKLFDDVASDDDLDDLF